MGKLPIRDREILFHDPQEFRKGTGVTGEAGSGFPCFGISHDALADAFEGFSGVARFRACGGEPVTFGLGFEGP